MKTGQFINYSAPYGGIHTPDHEATKLLDTADSLMKAGCKGVGYIYSANYGQTRTIQKTYFNGDWNSNTSGANQALLIMAVEKLLGDAAYTHLQGLVRIMPITTMNAYDHPLPTWNDDIHIGILNTDLDRIEYYLQCGWSILGLQDQDSNAHKPYAIGGNIANMSQAVSDFIQHTLIKFSQTYQ
jgi:hypothetical protein